MDVFVFVCSKNEFLDINFILEAEIDCDDLFCACKCPDLVMSGFFTLVDIDLSSMSA